MSKGYQNYVRNMSKKSAKLKRNFFYPTMSTFKKSDRVYKGTMYYILLRKI